MLIKGEALIDIFSFQFSIHGQRGDWRLSITAPGFPGSITTEDETSEPTWHSLFNAMLSDAYEAACRRRFPERTALAASGAKR